MPPADGTTTHPEHFGYCTGCRERFKLTDGAVPPHMWPYSTPLMIACSGGGKAAEPLARPANTWR